MRPYPVGNCGFHRKVTISPAIKIEVKEKTNSEGKLQTSISKTVFYIIVLWEADFKMQIFWQKSSWCGLDICNFP